MAKKQTKPDAEARRERDRKAREAQAIAVATNVSVRKAYELLERFQADAEREGCSIEELCERLTTTAGGILPRKPESVTDAEPPREPPRRQETEPPRRHEKEKTETKPAAKFPRRSD